MTNTATDSSYPQLPIIDLSAADRGPEARALLHAQLHSAAHDVGFFQLVGHGVSEEETGRLTSAMRAFFALPEAERLALDNVNSPHFRGYTRTGDERTGGSRDWRDQLDIGAERAARAPGADEPAYWWLQGPNQWPGALPELRTRRPRAGSTGSAPSPSGCCASCSSPSARPPISTTRLRRAGPSASEAACGIPGSAGDGADQGVGAHKDYGFLTLLAPGPGRRASGGAGRRAVP